MIDSPTNYDKIMYLTLVCFHPLLSLFDRKWKFCIQNS